MEDNLYLLVVGSRDFDNYALLCEKINEERARSNTKVFIVSGGARGADSLAKRYALENYLNYIEFPADWNTYGKSAGYIRNEQMHKFIAGHPLRKCIAFWDGKSRGTRHNFELAKKYNNDIEIIRYTQE